MQQQARAWPQLADRLSGLMDGLEARSRELDGGWAGSRRSSTNRSVQACRTGRLGGRQPGQELGGQCPGSSRGCSRWCAPPWTPWPRGQPDARAAGQLDPGPGRSAQPALHRRHRRAARAGWPPSASRQIGPGAAGRAGPLAGRRRRFEQGSAARTRAGPGRRVGPGRASASAGHRAPGRLESSWKGCRKHCKANGRCWANRPRPASRHWTNRCRNRPRP